LGRLLTTGPILAAFFAGGVALCLVQMAEIEKFADQFSA
jgi:hypothetical protein